MLLCCNKELAPNLCRLLAMEPEILARTEEGGRAAELCTYGRAGWELGERTEIGEETCLEKAGEICMS